MYEWSLCHYILYNCTIFYNIYMHACAVVRPRERHVLRHVLPPIFTQHERDATGRVSPRSSMTRKLLLMIFVIMIVVPMTPHPTTSFTLWLRYKREHVHSMKTIIVEISSHRPIQTSLIVYINNNICIKVCVLHLTCWQYITLYTNKLLI